MSPALDFQAQVEEGAPGGGLVLVIDGPGRDGDRRQGRYPLRGTRHADYLDLFEQLAADYGTRTPLSRRRPILPPSDPALEPLLTEPISPDLVYGYGDPSVIRVREEDGTCIWYVVVTSNDAPNAFPILRTEDLKDWRQAGFVFPVGRTPAWALTGENLADFWAPELHRVGEEYWLCFTARRRDHSLAIGMAKAKRPEGPYKAAPEPLVTGGVIDPHILLDRDGAPLLLWKVDDNDKWPPLLAALLYGRPDLVARLFPEDEDRRTARLVAALWPWTRSREPMEQFFVNQPMIEAATVDFCGFRERLRGLEGAEAQTAPILAALSTRIYGQPLAADGLSLTGEARLVLENDRPWEAHLIEGVWSVEHGGRYYLFYAGNDFSTPHYGIGVAVADAPLGPYRKLDEPLLGSSAEWWGPGHPSVAEGPGGEHRIFLHAFRPGQAGYKAFRVLLTARLRLDRARPALAAASKRRLEADRRSVRSSVQ